MTKLNENYKYKLQYVEDDKIITHEFNADIGANELAHNLRDFLCGCSWAENIVKEYILGEQ